MSHAESYRTRCAEMAAKGYVPGSVLAERWGVSARTVRNARLVGLMRDVQWGGALRIWFYHIDTERPSRGLHASTALPNEPAESGQVRLMAEWAVWEPPKGRWWVKGRRCLGWLGGELAS